MTPPGVFAESTVNSVICSVAVVVTTSLFPPTPVAPASPKPPALRSALCRPRKQLAQPTIQLGQYGARTDRTRLAAKVLASLSAPTLRCPMGAGVRQLWQKLIALLLTLSFAG
jgi:hypothetical protein